MQVSDLSFDYRGNHFQKSSISKMGILNKHMTLHGTR